MTVPSKQQLSALLRFLFFYLGPTTSSNPEVDIGLYSDIGVSLATAITDKAFAYALFNVKETKDLIVMIIMISDAAAKENHFSGRLGWLHWRFEDLAC